MRAPQSMQAVSIALAVTIGSVILAGQPGSVAAGVLAINRWTIDNGGGGYSRSGPWMLAGTVGQHDAALFPGSPFTVRGGFWGPGPLITTAVEMPDPTDPADAASQAAPRVARILPIAPNPTAGTARFGFDLPEPRRVEIRVYRVSGALVRTVSSRTWPAGRHQVVWDGRSENGESVAAGLYFARVRLGSLERSQKLLIVR